MFNPMQIMGAYQQFMQNPMAMLSKQFNIPQNLNDPQQIVQHLLSTNQISQDQVNNAKAMSNQFFNK